MQGLDRLVQRRPRYPASHQMNPCLRRGRLWKARTSSRSSLSGEWPKKRPNLETACTYDRWVAGDRLPTVMSSIMRRRSGLISATGGLPFQGWGEAPKPWQTERLERSATTERTSRASGLVQSRLGWIDSLCQIVQEVLILLLRASAGYVEAWVAGAPVAGLSTGPRSALSRPKLQEFCRCSRFLPCTFARMGLLTALGRSRAAWRTIRPGRACVPPGWLTPSSFWWCAHPLATSELKPTKGHPGAVPLTWQCVSTEFVPSEPVRVLSRTTRSRNLIARVPPMLLSTSSRTTTSDENRKA
jgi:hypothetical protein